MKRKKTILDALFQVCGIFGFNIILMMIFAYFLGEQAKEISDMFRLGSGGLALPVMVQFLGISAVTVLLQYIYFSNILFKKLSDVWRSLFMLASIILAVALFAACFRWFPLGRWEPWVLFLICLGVCFLGSMGITTVKTRIDNKNMAEGLKRYREEKGEEEDGELY